MIKVEESSSSVVVVFFSGGAFSVVKVIRSDLADSPPSLKAAILASYSFSGYNPVNVIFVKASFVFYY